MYAGSVSVILGAVLTDIEAVHLLHIFPVSVILGAVLRDHWLSHCVVAPERAFRCVSTLVRNVGHFVWR